MTARSTTRCRGARSPPAAWISCCRRKRSPEELARIARHSYIGKRAEEDGGGADHTAIAEIIRGATGVDFTHYKASTLRRRITRRMMLHRVETPAEYEEHLRQTPEEVEELYQDILISVTSFFRDPDTFDAVTRDVFPKLIAACPAGEACGCGLPAVRAARRRIRWRWPSPNARRPAAAARAGRFSPRM